MRNLDTALNGCSHIYTVIANAANRDEFKGRKQRHEFFVNHRIAATYHGANALQGAGVCDVLAIMHQVVGLQIGHQTGGQVGDTQNFYHVDSFKTGLRINTTLHEALAKVV